MAERSLPSCPPCPKCWSASAVSLEPISASRARCRCERCGTIWVHDATRIAALLRDRDRGGRDEP